ncbi:hypothetical protein CSOJ01_14672 [Colletotrichum sojae]|uniref:Serine hydrolase domain-containing protein n=1 Tax=Colletotrichum sojae TaxID=2175907 RepID=A0A8H6IPY8_9PEZI|nr:hypothetical protein CSOJ01_14672 [Colletotrichum sojae]
MVVIVRHQYERTLASTNCSNSEDGPDGGLFGYFEEPIDANNCRDLIEGLKDAAQSQGPFDGVVGFSEGGIVAATLLVEDARWPFAGFRCGILFSAAPPLDPDDLRSGIVRCMDPVRDGAVVRVPTAHIYSHEMDVAASKGQACVGGNVKSPLHELWAQAGLNTPEHIHASLARLCDESHVFVHDQGHRVPGSRSREALRGALRAIDRTIQSAQA